MRRNIAVIGCGYWGKNLVRNIAQLNALAAVCDPNEKLAQRYATEFSVCALSFDEVIASSVVEGVVLAVPAALHAEMAIRALRCGKHVFVEKPLALTEGDAAAMLDCAAENDRQLMVGHVLQYHPVFCELIRLVENNHIGRLNYIYSNRLSLGKVRSEENVVWSFAPHDISMILSLAGTTPIDIRAESHCVLQPGIADMATLHLDFPKGLKAHVSVSWLSPIKEQKLVVVGESGMLVFDDTKPWAQKLAFYSHDTKNFSSTKEVIKGEETYIEVPEFEPLKAECAHFIHVLEGKLSPKTDGAEGLRVLSVLTAASRAMSEQKVNSEIAR